MAEPQIYPEKSSTFERENKNIKVKYAFLKQFFLFGFSEYNAVNKG